MKTKTRNHLLLLTTTTGYQTRMFVDAAERLGVRCTLATDHCGHLGDLSGAGAVPVKFEEHLVSLDTLCKAHAGRGPFEGIVALGDRTTFLASLFAERAGLPFHPPHAVDAARNKFLSKQRFEAAGLLLPRYRRHPLTASPQTAAAEAEYPCVLKPLGLSGSRGVIRADSPAEFVAAFEHIRKLLADPDVRRRKEEFDQFVQVESFIPGEEFAVEGIVTEGAFQALALFDKPEPLNGPYFEETIYVTPSCQVTPVQAEILRTVERGVAALGLRHGPVHAEVRYNAEGAWILEVAGRPIGGYCAKALRFDGGISLEELIVRHALGEDVAAMRRESGASGVMMIPIPQAGIYHGAEGEENARAVPCIDGVILSAKVGQRVKKFPDASSYLGFLFARAPEPAQVQSALRTAHERLRFQIMTELT